MKFPHSLVVVTLAREGKNCPKPNIFFGAIEFNTNSYQIQNSTSAIIRENI